MLAITNLSFGYGKTPVLSGIDLTIGPGEIACLIGPNGAGKSTLLKCIIGSVRPSAGSVVLGGKPVETFGRRELARFASYVPQQTGSGMSLQVMDMVAVGRAPHRGLSTKSHDRDVVWDAIERLGLASLSLKSFGVLSGGQRQRVLIARALAQEGRLMLMDEPTSNLDPYYLLETASILRALVTERDIAVLVALHDLSLAARLSDGLVLMHRGRIHAQGGWRDVLTASHLEATFGVSALIGTAEGLPYVIPREPALTR